MTGGAARGDRGGVRLDPVVGVLVALVLLGAGFLLAGRQTTQYQASSSVVVLPDQTLAPEVVAGYYDTLSQGQVVGTFAEVLRVRAVPSAPPGSDVTVEAVPDTAVIRITATAPTAGAAEAAADAVIESTSGSSYVNEFYSPYRLAQSSGAAGTAEQLGVSRGVLLAVAGLVALVLGVVAQQGVRLLTATGAAPGLRPAPGQEQDPPRRAPPGLLTLRASGEARAQPARRP